MTHRLFTTLAAWLLALAAAPFATHAADKLQPYVLAYTAPAPPDTEAASVKRKLSEAGFTVVGEYSPYPGAQVVGITHPDLLDAAARSVHGAFGAAIHVSLTEAGGALQVAYLNPAYIAAAYRLQNDLSSVTALLAQTLGAQQLFGAGEGRRVKDLHDYRYMIGMESFEDPYRLGTHASHAEAVGTVEANLQRGVGGAALVYRVDIPAKEQTLFGVSRAQVEDPRANDKHILADTVDRKFEIKTTAYLPYQILVDGPDVVAPHMRFRMAVWHPELTMGTFGKLISSPGAIEELLRRIAGAKSTHRF